MDLSLKIESPPNMKSSLIMTPNSLHEDLADARSDSSTVCYNYDPSYHEPFETYRHKIAAVASIQFQQDVSKIKIEHMKGGSYNRVTAVIVPRQRKLFSFAWLRSWFLEACQTPETSESESYIVRVPRGVGDAKDFCVNRDIAILKTVGALLKLPIPKVVSYDLTSNNAIGKPYTIQPRLPGQNLARLWNNKTLNIEQMKCIARRVTELAPTIATVEGPGGNISLEALSSMSLDLKVESLHLQHKRLGDRSFTLPAQPQSTTEHLIETCRRWSEYYTDRGVPFDEIWYNFGAIIKSLDARGFLDGPCVLTHRDLMPYNLLVEVRSASDVAITGVIDWDSAVIAPEFVAYRAPFWLWTAFDVPSIISDDETTAAFPPMTEEAKILKQVFLDNASEKYKFFAFAPEAMLARRMYSILKDGTPGDWHIEEAWSIVREWDELHPEDGIDFPESDSDSDSGSMSDSG